MISQHRTQTLTGFGKISGLQLIVGSIACAIAVLCSLHLHTFYHFPYVAVQFTQVQNKLHLSELYSAFFKALL